MRVTKKVRDDFEVTLFFKSSLRVLIFRQIANFTNNVFTLFVFIFYVLHLYIKSKIERYGDSVHI